jgi:type 1 glutamine amidotransferase
MKATLFILGFLTVGAACAETPALRWDVVSSNTFALKLGDADVWRFHADPAHDTKPYFDPVAVAGAPSLTCPKPADHPWHLGLWFSWKFINGVNYWEEKDGKPDGATAWETPVSELRPDGSAVITLALAYTPARLRETREIVISAPAADGSYTMDWNQRFTADARVTLDRTPIPGEPNGVGWGGYAGLSCRFTRAFTDVQSFAAADGRVTVSERGTAYLYGVSGAEQSGLIDGAPYGLAMLPHPAAFRAPGDWYVIEQKGFTYLNAATLLAGAVTLEPGQTLGLRHRIHIHPGRWGAPELARAAAAYAAPPIRALILSGANNHDWRATTPAVKALLEQSGRFTVAVNDRPWDMTPADLDGVSLVISNWNTWNKDEKAEWTPAMKTAFLAWVERGGGFFVLHAGGCLFYDWDDFQSLTGGAWKLGATFHPRNQTFRLDIADAAHPVTRGMMPFETFDEPWQRIDARNPARRVLVTGVVAKENGGSGEPEPFAFVTERGKGRCFNLVLGHDVQALSNPGCRALILRGAAWTGGAAKE